VTAHESLASIHRSVEILSQQRSDVDHFRHSGGVGAQLGRDAGQVRQRGPA
jgi:hypothetical protein